MERTNVQRAMSVLSEADWETLFPSRLEIYTYDNFLQAMAKYPRFCDDHKDSTEEADLTNACKIELATLLAHVKFESNSLSLAEDIDCAARPNWVCKNDV